MWLRHCHVKKYNYIWHRIPHRIEKTIRGATIITKRPALKSPEEPIEFVKPATSTDKQIIYIGLWSLNKSKSYRRFRTKS